MPLSYEYVLRRKDCLIRKVTDTVYLLIENFFKISISLFLFVRVLIPAVLGNALRRGC